MSVSLSFHATDLLLAAPILLVVYTALRMVQNVLFHPLSSFPGPRLWAATSLVRHVYNVRGRMDWQIKRFHETYGPVVRVGPDELSFVTEQAWKDIYGYRTPALVKDPAFYDVVKLGSSAARSIFNAAPNDHPRIRKQLAHAFAERALREQEHLTAGYVDLLMAKLHGFAAAGRAVDMVAWFNFTTFDTVGDLAIGKSFNCLRDSAYHSWVDSLWNAIKIGPYMRLASAFVDVARLLRVLAPAHVRQARARHEAYVKDAARERLARGPDAQDRKDFLSYILPDPTAPAVADKGVGLSDDEVAANCGFIIMAGSETTATALSGTLYYLLQTPAAMKTLQDEVRGAFASEQDISFATTAARLPYTHACLTEGLRVYPPGPTSAPRRTPKHAGLTEIDGHMVPPWTIVGVHALSAVTNPSNFYQATSFHPERWLPEHINNPASPFFHDHRGASQPFSYGPRSCLGKSLAYNEMHVILARLIWNFDLELCESSRSWQNQLSYTLWEKPPLQVRLQAVQRA